MSKIVIIDDDENIRNLIGEVLSREGHVVNLKSNGTDGVRCARDKDIDLVITDIFMPGKEGMEIIQDLRTHRPNVPIIAISGGGRYRQTNLLKIALTLGADKVIEKPFDIQDLRDAVADLLEQ